MNKVALIAVLVLLPLVAALGAERYVNLDRCAIINDDSDRAGASKIAMRFDMPSDLSEKEICFVELVFSVPAEPLRGDSLLEVLLFSLTANWQEESIDYWQVDTITDSSLVGAGMAKLGTTREFGIDITQYAKDVHSGVRGNYGLVAQANLLGGQILRLPENQRDPIRNSARVRIVYK